MQAAARRDLEAKIGYCCRGFASLIGLCCFGPWALGMHAGCGCSYQEEPRGYAAIYRCQGNFQRCSLITPRICMLSLPTHMHDCPCQEYAALDAKNTALKEDLTKLELALTCIKTNARGKAKAKAKTAAKK